ncbi:MAG: Ribonuclease [Acidimicrobiales bacterium]|nr:Ribonuclease [Acidimicrobiales bacterium]
MPLNRLRTPADPALDLDAIRTELGVPGPFPAEVVAAAEASATEPPRPSVDATDIELVTIDPPGSRDLDQAVAIGRATGGGWRVHYAIADVASWVAVGDPVDREARVRTQTYYLPDGRTPLHPPALGEAAASLLPDGPRPAALWTIDVGADGSMGAVDVRRALVRSRARLDYAGVQVALDDGTAPASIAAFGDLGRALLADARRRDAIELGLPEQEVVAGPDGHWAVELRADLPIEAWNAQVSLLTGRAAANLMLAAGIGILRTLPAPDPDSFPRLRRSARSLGIDWPEGAHPGDVLAGLDTSRPRHAAFADLAAELLRGAGYTAFDGPPPADPGHAGVGAPYAHVTAPLRRLVDRFGTEVCLAVAAGTTIPAWAREALPTLPELMAGGDSRARKVDRAIVDATEAFVLADRVGEVFPASVVETGEAHGTVVLEDPAVRGRCDTPDLPLGGTITVRCTVADVAARVVRFERVA